MAVLNLPATCFGVGNNIEGGPCNYTPEKTIGLLIVPKGTTLSATQLLNLPGTINAGLTNTNPALRWHLFTGVKDNQPMNTDQVNFTYASGSITKIKDAVTGETLELDSSTCQYLQLVRYNSGGWKGYDFFRVTPTAIEGTVKTVAGVQSLSAYSLGYFNVPQWSIANNTDPTRFYLEYQHADVSQRTATLGFAQLQNPDGSMFSLTLVHGVSTVLILNPVAGTAGVFTVNLQYACGGVNFVTPFATQLPNVTNFAARNSATGATIPVTAVAGVSPDPTTGIATKIRVTLDSANANYPTAGNSLTLTMPITGLLANGIGNITGDGAYEGGPLVITI